MNLNQYDTLLILIQSITNISITVLLILLYKDLKNKRILYFLSLFIILFFTIKFNIDIKILDVSYKNEINVILTVVKLNILFFISGKIMSNIKRYILLTMLICIYFYMKINMMDLKIYNLLVNLLIINFICMYLTYIKYKNNKSNKNKLHMNKKYIYKVKNEIKKESMLYDFIDLETKDIHKKLDRIVNVINIPIIILKEYSYEYIFKNEYFDELLQKNNYKVEPSDINKFLREYVIKYVEKGLNEEKDFVQINISDKKYSLVFVRDTYKKEDVIICELKDITEIVKEEENLKRSTLRYKTLMDIFCDGVIIHDGENINYINKIGMDIFNLDDSLNKVWTIENIMDIVEKNSKNRFIQNIFMLQKGVKEEKEKLDLKNGKIVEFISSPFMLNEKSMILTIVSECTNREKALDKLHENKKTYYTLLQTLPEGIILLNKYSKKQVYANKYMMRLLKDIGMDNFNKIIDSYMDNKENVNFRSFYINKERNKKLSIAIEEVPKQDNLLIIVRDLEIEQQMEKVYNNLQIIKERNKFKTEFLTRAALNLKKPINTIFEVNKFLCNKKDIENYDGVKSYTKTVKQNAYRLKRLLNNIEEISKIEAGIYIKDYKTYDIVEYLQDLVNLCKDYTNKKGIEISFESNKKEILIYMDKEKVEKIILNILSNAIKFTEKGGKISVLLIENNKKITIAIKDNGSGIPSNKINFIFENFEQVNRSLSRTAEGTGVGLYLVKKLALIHHAKIKVNSKIGCGSKFEIILEDNFLENNKENREKIESIIIDKESIALEFSDIYLV